MPKINEDATARDDDGKHVLMKGYITRNIIHVITVTPAPAPPPVLL